LAVVGHLVPTEVRLTLQAEAQEDLPQQRCISPLMPPSPLAQEDLVTTSGVRTEHHLSSDHRPSDQQKVERPAQVVAVESRSQMLGTRFTQVARTEALAVVVRAESQAEQERLVKVIAVGLVLLVEPKQIAVLAVVVVLAVQVRMEVSQQVAMVGQHWTSHRGWDSQQERLIRQQVVVVRDHLEVLARMVRTVRIMRTLVMVQMVGLTRSQVTLASCM
jgi:hypothetical protein